jgi:hypothetical protein
MTDEQKAEAKAKREAAKAAEKAAAPAAPAAPPVEKEAAPPAAPKPEAKKAVFAPKKKVDLTFFKWSFEGKDYITNDRGDVVSTEFEWVGRFDGTKIDGSAPEPADLADAKMRQ